MSNSGKGGGGEMMMMMMMMIMMMVALSVSGGGGYWYYVTYVKEEAIVAPPSGDTTTTTTTTTTAANCVDVAWNACKAWPSTSETYKKCKETSKATCMAGGGTWNPAPTKPAEKTASLPLNTWVYIFNRNCSTGTVGGRWSLLSASLTDTLNVGNYWNTSIDQVKWKVVKDGKWYYTIQCKKGNKFLNSKKQLQDIPRDEAGRKYVQWSIKYMPSDNSYRITNRGSLENLSLYYTATVGGGNGCNAFTGLHMRPNDPSMNRWVFTADSRYANTLA